MKRPTYTKVRTKALAHFALLPFSLFTLLPFLASCSEEKIDSWDTSNGFVWFTDTVVTFTNMQQPDVPMGGTLRIAVPLTFATEAADHDRAVSIEVAKAPTDSRTQVTLENAVLPADSLSGYAYVDLVNSSHLDQVYDTLTLKVAASADFQPGLPAYQTVKVCMHNGYPKPDWWTKRAENILGYFTQLKMQIYVTVKGDDKDPRTNTNSSYWSSNDLAVQYLVYRLNDYIQQNNIKYPDDDPEHPGMTPKFARRSY